MRDGGGLPLARALDQALERDDRVLTFYSFDGPGEGITFREFGRGVTSVGQRLQELGVGPGTVVALLAPTGLELCRAAAAVWSIGAALTVLATPSRLSNLETYMLETLGKLSGSQASVLLGEASMVEAFADLVAIPALSWQQLEAASGEVRIAPPESPVQAALIQFSSGTTREPQPILLSDAALLANSRSVLARFPGGAETSNCVSWLPLYHDMGLIGCFLMPLLAPANLTLMGPEVFAARPVTWLEAISEQRGTISSAPNFALGYCADRVSDDQMAGLDLSSWSIAMVGAETVRPPTLRRFAQRFASVGFSERAFSPVYGLAEATLAVTFSPLGEGLKTLSLDSHRLASSGEVGEGSSESPSLGRPLDGVEVSIRSGGRDLPEGRLGEVYVKGPSLFSGYLGQPTSDRLTEDGWLRTGDMGFLHQGELHLYGRRRDILLLDGRNHDPNLIEGAVEALPELRRCCAFTLETGDRDCLVLACEVGFDFEGDVQSLRDQILATGRKASGLTPSRLLLLKAGSLPITSSGKLRRSETVKLHAADALEVWQPQASSVSAR